jgi:hypothetical protein
MYLLNNLGTREGSIRQYVIDQYLSTGEHLFITDIAKQFRTSTVVVNKALSAGGGLGFDRFEADRWSGHNFSGRYIHSPAVEPSKGLLRALAVASAERNPAVCGTM